MSCFLKTKDLFFNRLIAGVCTKKLDAFSANHSYYDTFNHKEYFNNQSSSKSYPFFYGFKNKIAFYPILSPCKLKIKIQTIEE